MSYTWRRLSVNAIPVQRRDTPVGMWVIRTAVSTLFTFWPPLPPALVKVISRSSSGISTSRDSSGRRGMTSTPEKLVWNLNNSITQLLDQTKNNKRSNFFQNERSILMKLFCLHFYQFPYALTFYYYSPWIFFYFYINNLTSPSRKIFYQREILKLISRNRRNCRSCSCLNLLTMERWLKKWLAYFGPSISPICRLICGGWGAKLD